MNPTSMAQRRSVFWRIHLWAALIASPFALVGALTGMLYVFTPQIESVLHGHLDRVKPGAQRVALDELVAAAERAVPTGSRLRHVVTPEQPHQSVRVTFAPAAEPPAPVRASEDPHAEHRAETPGSRNSPADLRPAKMNHGLPQGRIVYLHPYTGEVLGQHAEMDRFSTWSKRLHSSLLQGDGWRWLLELSTSWLVVMLLTGLYLGWPRAGQTVLPRSGLRGRANWRQWHAGVGMALAVLTLVMLITGLTWSRYAGDQIKAAAHRAGQSAPELPKGLRSQAQPGQVALGWQDVLNAVQAQAPSIAYQITPPKRPDEPWRITNFDRSQPTKRFTLLLDGYTGQALYFQGWSSFSGFSKATAVGIPFHRGEFGGWNQALLLLFGLGIVWGLLSGWVMFLKRQRRGLLGLPRLTPGAWRSLPWGAWVAGGVLLLGLPLLAASAAVVAAVEAGLAWRAVRRSRHVPMAPMA